MILVHIKQMLSTLGIVAAIAFVGGVAVAAQAEAPPSIQQCVPPTTAP